jgi:dipeptidyl aminopeptidase/acylaminoacyl peptidase
MEKQIAFTVEGQKLYGMLHIPEGVPRFPAIAMLHGFSGQRIEPHRLFVKTARRLSQEGIAVLRFDFRGSGESEGDFYDMTLSGEIKDALAALDFLRAQPEVDIQRLGVIGLSMGGYVATCVTTLNPKIKALVLWAASAKGLKMFPHYVHLSAKNRKDWLQKGERDFGGMVLGSGFLKDGKNLPNPLPGLSRFSGKALVIHGEADASVPVTEAQVYRDLLKKKAVVHILKGADHTFNRNEWEKTVIDITAVWLRDNL